MGNAGPDDKPLSTLERELEPSVVMDSKQRRRMNAMENSMDKRAKVRERALIFEQMRIASDREKLSPKKITIVKDEDQQMEVMRQERSRKDASDDLKMKNIKAVLMKLLNKTGLGRYV